MAVNTCKPVGNVLGRNRTLRTLIVNSLVPVHIRQKEKDIQEIAFLVYKNLRCNSQVGEAATQRR